MKKKLLAGLTAGLFLFCVVGLANATLIKQKFYIEIDSINIGSLDPEVSNISCYDCPAIGSRYYGTVTYNNANIPKSGSYIIGENVYFPYVVHGNELQALGFNWFNTNPYVNMGFGIGNYDYAYLTFMGSKISAMDGQWTPDFYPFINQAVIHGNSYRSWGEMMFSGIYNGVNFVDLYTPYGLGGTVHFSTPEPTTMLLLALGLIGLAGVKRKFKE